jgi:hypothetical protein
VPDVKQPRGHPRHRPDKLHAAKAYSSRKNRRGFRQRRLCVRDERRDDIHFGLVVLGCCLILFRGLQT